MTNDIKAQVKLMPKLPGCYQFFDSTGEIIYIGKAKNLYNRVNSYFIGRKDSPKLQVMVPQIVRVECIVVDSEIEALILENELIKKYKPKYNILLKDDKKFPYFVITKEDYPRIIIARKANLNPEKGTYFGPYTDSRAMHVTLDILGKIFPLKKCKTPKFNSRPCLYYDIGKCLAPCQRLVTPEEYQAMLKNVELFLSGKQMELVKIMQREMEAASKKAEFERAMALRDCIRDILKTIEKQKVVSENTRFDYDYIATASSGSLYTASILEVREGRLIGKKDFEFTRFENAKEQEVLEAVLSEYYSAVQDRDLVKNIIIEEEIDDIEIYKNWLSARRGKQVIVKTPKKKAEQEILNMARTNAQFHLQQLQIKELTAIQNDFNEVGVWIQEKLSLKNFPHLMECYDISHTQGTNTVASKVVFQDGVPKKSLYRKYKLRTIEKGEVDDFKSMREILTRRLTRIKSGVDKKPDLIIIDGGMGQLSSVMQVVDELGLRGQLDIVSLAKREEEIFLPESSTPVIFPINSPALHLFQRIRDEAHRFAITFHKSLRAKQFKK